MKELDISLFFLHKRTVKFEVNSYPKQDGNFIFLYWSSDGGQTLALSRNCHNSDHLTNGHFSLLFRGLNSGLVHEAAFA